MTISMTGEPHGQIAGSDRAMDAARVLRTESASLLDAWSGRVRSDDAIPSTSRVDDRLLRDHFPSLIDDLAGSMELVARGADPGGATVRNVAARTAFAHAVGRVEAGYSIGETLREISHLRMAACDLLERRGATDTRVARALSAWTEGAMRIAAEETSRIASAALGASEAAHRTLIEGITHQAIIRLDSRGRVMTWGPAAERILGLSAAQAIGAPHMVFFTGEDCHAGHPERLLRRAEVSGRAIDDHQRVRHDGSRFFAEVVLTPLREPDETLSGYAMIICDMTERTEAERSLRTRDVLLHAVIDHTPSVVYVKDRSGRNLLANRQFERVLGISRRAIEGRLDDELFPPDEVRAFRATDARVIEAQTEIEVEEVVRHADGPHTYESVKFPVRDADGEVWAVGGISTDVTERRRAEIALAESEWRFRTIFDVAPIGIVDVDANSKRITRANAEACRMTGHAPGELDGADMDALTHEEDRAQAEAALRPVLAGREELYDHEKRFRRKDGGWLHARVRATLVRDAQGRPVRALALIEDVGARRELELLRERLVAIVAHDLRGPLSTVRMALQLLRLGDPNAPCDPQLIEKIDRGSRGMQEMISTLLDFARAQGGAFPIDRQDTDLAAIACSVVEDSRMAAPGRQIELEIEGDSRGRWDPSRLAQVIANLLSNALRHGDPAAPVRVRVHAPSNEHVELDVWNQGTPIPPEMMSAIFEPYRRGEETTTGGLGLGLYITNAIVRAHGGKLRVTRSDREHGTVFSVELPRR